MPKRTDIESILIIGAGPIIIGQACEFDYSGAQACKALKEEGYRVILVNSNPATIMTDPEMADSIYIEPINWRTLARIIEKEKPDALLPTMGGQTALNTALDLVRSGGRVILASTKGDRAFHFISDVLVAKQLTIKGAMGATSVGYQWAARQIETDPRIDDLVSHQFPLAETPRALQAAAGLLGREELISAAVTF